MSETITNKSLASFNVAHQATAVELRRLVGAGAARSKFHLAADTQEFLHSFTLADRKSLNLLWGLFIPIRCQVATEAQQRAEEGSDFRCSVELGMWFESCSCHPYVTSEPNREATFGTWTSRLTQPQISRRLSQCPFGPCVCAHCITSMALRFIEMSERPTHVLGFCQCRGVWHILQSS